MSALSVHDLAKSYGGVVALHPVTLTVEPGERRAIIGPNGAGKTTLFRLISGQAAPDGGRVLLGGRDVTRLPVHARAQLGLAQTFQRNNLFLSLSVLDNVRLAVQREHGLSGRLFRPLDHDAALTAAAEQWLSELGLHEQRRRPAGTLAYGQQRVLEVALALASRPRVLLLDEPTAGMSPAETAAMIRLLQALPRSLTLLIVEHDMDVVFTLADRLTVLHNGQVISEGGLDAVRADPRVQAVYLGASH